MRLPLYLTACRPGLDEPGPTSLREADVDDIEVLRNDRLREDRARLTDDLRPEVSIREMRESEKADTGRSRELRSTRRGGMERLVGPLALLVRERGLVHQEVRASRRLEHRRRRTSVPGDDHLPARARRAENLLWADRGAVGQVDRDAILEAAEKRPLGHAEPPRFLQVEAAGTRHLDERVSIGRDPVLDGKRLDPVVGAVEPFSGLELDQRELVVEPPEDTPQDSEEVAETRRPVDGQRDLPPAKGERLQHAGQAEIVIGVVVRQEDLRELDEADRGTQKLTLGALAAVEEESLPTAAHQETREAAPGGRH
jgi:hypothetical protein